MSLQHSAPFYPISTQIFHRISGTLTFDVYVKRGTDTYTKVFPMGEAIDAGRLSSYESKGVSDLHVPSEQYAIYLSCLELVIDQKDLKSVASDHKEMVLICRGLCEISLLKLKEVSKIDQQTFMKAEKAIHNCVDLIADNPSSIFKILSPMFEQKYLLKHSFYVTALSLMLGAKVGLEDKKKLVTLGIGALFHDIGMNLLTNIETHADICEDAPNPTAEEIRLIKCHTKLGNRLLDALPFFFSAEIKAIIAQHHEQPDGKGYPDGLSGNKIFKLAKIVSICDDFATHTVSRPYRSKAMSTGEALLHMHKDVNKFDPELLNTFCKAIDAENPAEAFNEALAGAAA